MPTEEAYIGLISGTSINGVDAGHAAFNRQTACHIAHHQQAYPEALRDELATCCQPGENEIARLGEADIQTPNVFADTSLALLKMTDTPATSIRATCSRGSPNGGDPGRHLYRHKPLP